MKISLHDDNLFERCLKPFISTKNHMARVEFSMSILLEKIILRKSICLQLYTKNGKGMPVDILIKLVNSMPQRCPAVIT